MERRTRQVFRSAIAAAALMAMSTNAMASLITVDAKNHSSTVGTGVGTGASTGLNLLVGQQFSVTVPLTMDLWNAGALPRWSNAAGLTTDLFYAPGIDSQVPVYATGTKIGQNFGTWTQGGFTAPFGSLVGQVGAGAFFLIGTSYLGSAVDAGELRLFYWDSVDGDNTGSIQASVNAVPLPAAAWLLLSGLVGFAALGRRRPMAGV